MNKEKENALHEAFEKFMDMSLMQIPISEDADQFIAKDIMGYGTTSDEVINSFAEWEQLIHLQVEQGAELDFVFVRKPYFKRISENEDSALFVETIETSITAEGFKNEFTFRISALLEYTSSGSWQMIHWHGSIPSATENDSWHVNEWKNKNELLEKEVRERTAELEAKNRELEIEAAVGKVRNKALAMQSPSDIMSVLEVLNESIAGLNLNDLSPFIWIKEEGGWFNQYDISKVDSKGTLANFNFRVFPAKYPQCNKAFEKVLSGEKYFISKYEGQDLVDIANEVYEIDPVSGELFRAAIKEGHISEYYQATACFEHGAVGLDYNIQPDASVEGILIKMADAIGLAYQRVDELQLKEKQAKALVEEKERLDAALEDLKSTQSQLIQSEKMASLGELTAGIAHEIQNPLNFVNNFSEVSTELIDEMNEELDKGDIEEAKAIGVDLKENLSKINHHGKRADAIVKGMLEHSRSTTTEKEPTKINVLVDEFFRLSYQGLRAKDKSFNATLECDYDDTIGKVNVNRQDIGRVVLNLINNAFYAVHEKNNSGAVDYKPTVSISTKNEGDKIIISIKDNGNGIPDAIKEKIFQPFFTTKPTGSGTGLGLSLSYDIVKAHGGELGVETKQNEGTEFIIYLPL